MGEERTQDDLEVLFCAWALYAKGQGFAPTPDALPPCIRMTGRGWLERRWHEHDAVSSGRSRPS